MNVLIASDVFPPRCGGAGWSAYYLARALRARGHQVAVVRPRFDPAARRADVCRTTYDDLPLAEAVIPLPASAVGRLLTRNLVGPRFLRRLVAAEAQAQSADLIHAQHALTVPAAVGAAAQIRRRTGHRIPVVATVRDYWPLSYFSTMQVPDERLGVGSWGLGVRDSGSGTGASDLTQHATRNTQHARLTVRNPKSEIRSAGLPALAQAFWRVEGARSVRRWPLLPLWWGATAWRRRAMRRTDAVIAVSRFVAAVLTRNRAVDSTRLHIIPNLVDLPRVDAVIADPAPLDALGLAAGQPYLLFVGKLDASKGAQFLPVMLQAAGVGGDLPLVLAGSGPLAAPLAAHAQLAGLDFRFADWLDNDAVLRLLHEATLLLFPSAWDEPLSRVLLEACAVGTPILALDTGGTADILTNGCNARLVADLPAFAAVLRDLLADQAARARLGAAARATAESRFSAPVVAAQVERLYQGLGVRG